jgi:hypothetical protein
MTVLTYENEKLEFSDNNCRTFPLYSKFKELIVYVLKCQRENVYIYY